MKRVVTAISNPILNNKLKKEEDIEIVGNDVQYQEGIIELLEKEKNINYLILSELLPRRINNKRYNRKNNN